MRTTPCTMSGLSSWPTMPRRGAEPMSTSRDVAHARSGMPFVLGEDDVLDVVDVPDEADAADGVRLLADDEALPADVRVRRLRRA